MTNMPKHLRAIRSCIFCGLLFAVATVLQGQDARQTLPDNYQREFENAYVRVTRVSYPAHAKLPAHSHTSLASAYVYLNDSGPVAFKHVGAEYGVVTRPPTVAGAFRVYRGLDEIHEVENLSELPSVFLRIEFKTDPIDPRSLRGKFLPDPPTEKAFKKVVFENPQVRIARIRWNESNRPELTEAEYPRLFVSLAEDEMGKVHWLARGRSDGVPGLSGAKAGEALQIEFKTGPIDGSQ